MTDKALDYCSTNVCFPPVAVIWNCQLLDPLLIELKRQSDTSAEILKNSARMSDISIVIFTSSSEDANFCDPLEIRPPKYLVMNVHTIGLPSYSVSVDLETLKNKGEDIFSLMNSKKYPLESIIYSPIDWSVASINYGKTILRYVSGFESKNEKNVCFSVREDMDTGEFTAEATIRNDWQITPTSKKIYGEFDSIESAIEGLTEKFLTIKGKTASESELVFEYQYSFEIEKDSNAALGMLQEDSLWKTFTELKHAKDKD